MRGRIDLLVAILLVSVAAAGCGGCERGGDLRTARPIIRVASDTVDFGLVRVWHSSVQTLRVENLGASVLNLTDIDVVDGPYAEWFTVSPRTERVGIGGFRDLEITFIPRAEEDAEAILLIHSNDEDKPTREVVLRGTGFVPLVDVTPLRLDFGNVVLETNKKKTVTLVNNGEEAANVQVRSVTGQGSSQYRVQAPSGATDGSFVLMPGQSTEIDVTYAPTTRGRHLAAFTIEPCDNCMPAMVDLIGVGIDSGLVVEPLAVEFGAVNPGSPVSRPVTFKNIGNRHIQIVDLSIVSLTGGAPSRAFTVESDSLPFDLDEGEEVEVAVVFGPTDLQHHVAGLDWESTDTRNRTGRIPLSGRGGGPNIELVPRTLAFGLVAVGAPMPRSLVILNTGFERLDISSIEILDEPAFKLVEPFSHASIEVGDFLEVAIEFNPSVAGRHDGRVVVRSNDPDEPDAYAQLSGEALDLPPCQFEVRPEEVRFGIVERNRSRVQQFAVTNVGGSGEQCLIAVLDLEPGTSNAFSLPGGQISGLLLDSGETLRVDVAFKPTRHGVFTGAVEFYVSDPTAPRRTIGLHGSSQAAGVLVAPDELSFGQVKTDCASKEREICVYNTGSSQVRVTGVSMNVNGPDQTTFSFASVPPAIQSGTGVAIGQGDKVCFSTVFRPTSLGTETATVEVTIDGFDDPFVVILDGTGAVDAFQTDFFTQLEQPMADILFVIDDSCSMAWVQHQISDNLEPFMQFAIDQGIDYHIGVITTSAGEYTDYPDGGILWPVDGSRPRVITPRLADPLGVFRQNVMVGTDGDYIERGFRSAEKFFDPAYQSDPNKNAGFLRPDAHLAIIFVSDEKEQSQHSVDYYLNVFRQVKGFRRPDLLTASSIVDYDGSCPNIWDGPHNRYKEIALQTGGVLSSICSDNWADDLRDLSSVAFGYRSRFNLTNVPVEGTIRVTIHRGGGSAVEAREGEHWEFDPEQDVIQFDAMAIPEAGDVIEVTYQVECL